MPRVFFLIAPVLSVFLGPSPDSPELAVYSWYDNQTTDWINTNYNTHMISYSFFVLMMAFLFLLITATCIEKYTSFKALVIWAWAIWFLLGCLTLFIMACYGLNQARLMNSVYNEKMLFEEMTKAFREFESLPGNKTNHTWVLTQQTLNCSALEDCFHKLDQGIKEFTSSSYNWIILANIFSLMMSLILSCCTVCGLFVFGLALTVVEQ